MHNSTHQTTNSSMLLTSSSLIDMQVVAYTAGQVFEAAIIVGIVRTLIFVLSGERGCAAKVKHMWFAVALAVVFGCVVVASIIIPHRVSNKPLSESGLRAIHLAIATSKRMLTFNAGPHGHSPQ